MLEGEREVGVIYGRGVSGGGFKILFSWGRKGGIFFQDRINCPFFLMFFTMRRDDG